MNRIRAYFLFTSWEYKLGIFLGLPLAVLAGGLAWHKYIYTISIYGYLVMIGLILVEIFTDQRVFNGIQARKGYKLDYLKTSFQGPCILQWGLTIDLARRFLTVAVCIGLSLLTKAQTADGGIAEYLGMLLAIYSAETLGLFISRYTRSLILCMFTAYGCATVGLAGFSLVCMLPPLGLWVTDTTLALAAMLLSLLAVRTAMKKWRQTYYDIQE